MCGINVVGGGGVSDFTTIEGRSQTSVFFRSPLDQKEAIGVVFRSMDPPQAILAPRRVRVTLIPGSTLMFDRVFALGRVRIPAPSSDMPLARHVPEIC